MNDERRSSGLPAPRRIPEATVVRLPIYQRILAEMVRGGARTVSSEQLAELARVNAAKVRKDLSLLGSFGTRGAGYDAAFLIEQIDRQLFPERLIARLSSFFGLLALVLACIGLYGLLSFEVTRRTREIGIRMALGAKAGDVLRAVIAQGITLATVGIAIGMGVALGVTRFLGSLLYNVKAGDPLTFAGVALLLVTVAGLACYIPALRAARVDPMVALRYE